MTCSTLDCGRALYARGHCSRHYRQLLRHGEVQPEPLPPGPCAAKDCERAAVTRGWCHGHYLRWSRTGDVKADKPLARSVTDSCKVEDCSRGAHSGGLCRSHAWRLTRHGNPLAGAAFRTATGGGSLNNGYWWVGVPDHLRHLVPPGRRGEFEHRLVLAESLGRALHSDEVVHHLNGDRLDNDLPNLELWTVAQPKGQRVTDKLAFALGLLARYDQAICEALGLDLDPATGAPHDLAVNAREPAADRTAGSHVVAPKGFEPSLPP
jgi:hypothetical protein